MLTILLIILILLWFLGYIHIAGLSIPDITLFTLNSHEITLFNILTLIVIAWIIGLLPNPFRVIASIILILWVLSILGILAIAGLANILIIVVIVGLIFLLVSGGI